MILSIFNADSLCIQPQTRADDEAEKDVSQSFRKIAGNDHEIGPYELQHILNTAYMKGSQPHHIIII